ncbi:MAG TPA: rhodanese-like domain-containing protein [Candidatus Kapabacteria bacterium]|jgi:rhodanese-related sulfurtransferase|nr:rhodanese-like domain-containing protein [Candidatus Kapabacteria bacterium]
MQHSERFLKLVEAARLGVREISPEETNAKLEKQENVLIIDTREDHEWERGHVAGALHLGKGIIERDIESVAPDLDQPIILYCGGGYRSVLAAEALARMGYTKVSSMSSGWKGWQVRGYPVEGGESSPEA